MWIFAHQGGWDEFLYFSIPVVLGFFGLRYAEKKAKAKNEAAKRAVGGSQEQPSGGDQSDGG